MATANPDALTTIFNNKDTACVVPVSSNTARRPRVKPRASRAIGSLDTLAVIFKGRSVLVVRVVNAGNMRVFRVGIVYIPAGHTDTDVVSII